MLLREKDNVAIIKFAKQTLKTPLEILVYGSRINVDAHDMSDLDLVLLTESKKKLDINELVNFKDVLQKSNIPILIQVLDFNRIPDSFKKNIFKNYEVILKI